MGEKKNDRFTIAVIMGILMVFSIVDFFVKFGLVGDAIPSPADNISFSAASFHSGNLMQQYEDWEARYFFNRTKFEKIVLDIRILMGKRDLNGYYLGRNGRYFVKRPASSYSEEALQEGLARVGRLANDYDATIMLVPTAEEIWKEDLPKHADSFDQKAYLEQIQKAAGSSYLDIYSSLDAHKAEKIYYESDPHWTSLAAYYAYQAWREKLGKQYYYLDRDRMVTVTEGFLGTYAVQDYFEFQAETVCTFKETYRNPIMVLLDGEREEEGYYRRELLGSDHPYDYFLGNDFTVARIETGREREKSLFVIGDSYASCVIPLFAPHYSQITFLNMEQFDGDLWKLLDRYREDGKTEFLLLQNIPTFLQGFED